MATPTKRPARRIVPPARDDERDVDAAEVEPERSLTETPTPTAPTPMSNGATRKIRRGHTAAQQVMDSTSSFAQILKPNEHSQVIKFLEDDPYASYKRHWVDRLLANGQRGKRSFTCLDTIGEPCPLCQIGDRPQGVAAYNVALLDEEGGVTLKSWEVQAKIFNILKGYANDQRIGPLTRGFFRVSKTGKSGSVNHNVNPVSARALEEDEDTPVPSQTELDRLGRYDSDIVEIPSVKTMRELAAELAGED